MRPWRAAWPLVLALAGSVRMAAAQGLPVPRAGADTLASAPARAHRLGPVLVRAVRPQQFAVGSRQWALDSLGLALYRGGTVAEALQARTPLYLKNYGPNQLASISIRGTSARHTAVLWHGFNVNLPSLGEADFATLPLSGAGGQVAVQPGPAAALYGSGAVGGAVLLGAAEPDWRPAPWQGTGQLDAGSFGLRGGSLALRAATGRVALRTAASLRAADNDYPYVLVEAGGPVRRRLENAALRHQFSLSQDAAWRLGEAGELTGALWLTDTDREIQPARGAANDHARQRDQNRRLLLGYRRVLAGGGQWAVRGAWFDDVLDYRSDNAGASNSRVQTTQAQAEHTRALGPRATLRLGAEAQHFAADVDGYGRTIGENRGAAFALLRYVPRPALRLALNLRQALLPGGAAPLAPTLGLEYDLLKADSSTAPSRHHAITPSLTLKASAARSYRAPTLNERYWRPGGNPDLQAETGLGGELGLRHARTLGASWALEAELTAYAQQVNNWVQWTPGADGLWRPRNLRQVDTRGLELSARLRYRAGRYALAAQAAYGFTQARKTAGSALDADPVGRQLPFVPLHQGALVLDQTLGRWLLSANLSRTGQRYLDASATAFLPAFWLLGAAAGRTVPLPGGACTLTVLVQGTNLLNLAYDSYPARPAPPRAGQLSLQLGWR